MALREERSVDWQTGNAIKFSGRHSVAAGVAGSEAPAQLLTSDSPPIARTMVVATSPIRVLIVDDHELIRSGLAELLGREPNVTVVGSAASGEEALAIYGEHKPDVTLVDMRMTPMDGVEVIMKVREIDPGARLIMLTNYDTDEDVYRGLRAGAARGLAERMRDTAGATLGASA